MLTPITALLTGVTAPEWPSEARAAALSRLRDELLGPIYGQVSLPNGIVERVFAHGEQPLRVIQRDDDSALIERYEFGGALEAPEDAKGDWQFPTSVRNFCIDREQSIVSIVGNEIAQTDDVLMKLFDAIREVPVTMVSYGGSHHNISILLPSAYKTKTLQLLNAGLFGL